MTRNPLRTLFRRHLVAAIKQGMQHGSREASRLQEALRESDQRRREDWRATRLPMKLSAESRALAHLFETRGEVSDTEVARRAGISRMTLHRSEMYRRARAMQRSARLDFPDAGQL
jgi:transcriptional regulator of acetoin/glycerol metabolism